MPFPGHRRASLAAAAALATMLGLAACAPEPDAPATSTTPPAAPSAQPTGSSAAPLSSTAPAPTSTPLPAGTGTPLGLGCTDLITLDEMYAFNPNITLRTDTAPVFPQAGAVTGYSGTVCQWANDTSGEPIDIGAAALDAQAEAYVSATWLTQGAPTTAFGGGADAVFGTTDGYGVAQVLSGGRWIVVASPMFLTAEGAAPLVDAVVAHAG